MVEQVKKLLTRREFLRKGLTLATATATVPTFLAKTAFSIENPYDSALVSSKPGIPDERAEAIQQLRNNLKDESVSFGLGINQLIWIYLDYKKYDEAESLTREALELFPESRFFL